MPVYVDRLREWGWKLGASCHMYADTNEELHEFAARLGLKREWFQKATSSPHYDLTAKKRKRAVELGAIEHTDRQMIAHMRRWAAMAVARVTSTDDEEERNRIREDLYR